MLGVPEIGLPQGICWESHDEPGREPRPQGTIALSTQGAQPGSPEDKRWPLSLAVTMDVQTPTPQQPKVSPGGDLHPTTWDEDMRRWDVPVQIPPVLAPLVPRDCPCAGVRGLFTTSWPTLLTPRASKCF